MVIGNLKDVKINKYDHFGNFFGNKEMIHAVFGSYALESGVWE